MGANAYATGWMQAFIQMRRPTKFLQSFFTVKPGNIFNGKKVEIDIQRFGEDIAVALRQGKGMNLNDADVVTTKEMEPPKYGEAFPANVEDLVERMVGVDPYSDAYTAYATKLVQSLLKLYQLGIDKISRGIELQAAQVLQTGVITLVDADGTVYEIDFSPKATHFPTVSTAWDAAGSTKLADLESLATVIRADGQVNPDMLIMGGTAFNLFIQDENVQKLLDNRRYELGEISPQMLQSGATFQGRVSIGSYQYQIWTYPEGYKNLDGDFVQYIDTNKVVMLSSQTRLDRLSARVPLPLGPDPRVASLMPGRINGADIGIDVTPNLWCTPNGKQLMAEIESRTLLAPIQIDGFGCLTTDV